MFLEQGVKPENHFWKYLVGSVIIILASTVGQIPLLIAILVKSFMEGTGIPTTTEELMTVLDSNLTFFLILISFVFAMAAIYLVVKYFHKEDFIKVTTARKKMDWNRVFFSFAIWAVFTILSTLATYYISPENFVLNFRPMPFLILALIAVFLVPIQTSTEEYVFRGYLMQGFANLSLNKWFPLIMTSSIFGLMHIFNPEVSKMGYIILVYYIGTGLLLGIMTLMDDGIELALGFHAANNLIGALLVTSDWSAFQTNSILKDISDPAAGLEVIMPIFIIYPLLLFIFSRKYNWTDWKEKLTGNISPIAAETIETSETHE